MDKKNGKNEERKAESADSDTKDKDDDDKDDEDKDQNNEETNIVNYERAFDGSEGNPLVITLFEFLTEPRSSRAATYWGWLMFLLFVMRVLLIAFESCDGPNHFEGREIIRPRYYFFFSANSYWLLYAGMLIPMIIDAFLRLIVVLVILFSMENIVLKKKLMADKFTLIMSCLDIFGVSSFFVVALYLRPNNIVWESEGRLILRIVELCGSVKILRVVKDIAGIFAIRAALSASMPHLKVPIYFFFTFNIFVACFLYFLEPCYNTSNCPWKNLFDVSFYSVVTMTTTGYGNQVPYSLTGRVFGCSVMLFGALFMSMPLAIIGNSYEKEWGKVKEMNRRKEVAEEKKNDSVLKAKTNWKKITPLIAKELGEVAPLSEQAEKEEAEKADYKLIHNAPLIICFKNLTILIEKLLADISHSFRLNTAVLSGVCELRGVIANTLVLIRGATFVCEGIKKSLIPSENYEAGRQRIRLLDPTAKLLNEAMIDKKEYLESKDPLTMKSIGKRVILAENKNTQLATGNLQRARNRMNTTGHFVSDVFSKKSYFSWFASFFSSEEPNRIRTTSSTEYEEKLREVTENPNMLRNRVWVLLEMPDETPLSRIVHIVFIVTIIITVFVLFTETMVSLTQYGEKTSICHSLVEVYCKNKEDPSSDAGCWASDEDGVTTNTRLKFGCTNNDCIGFGTNFGAANSNITCANADRPPFEDMDQLALKFGKAQFQWSRTWNQQIYPICTRIECSNNALLTKNAPILWNAWEIFSNLIFSIELALRIIISRGFLDFLKDQMNVFDMFSILPFYMEVFAAIFVNGGGFKDLDFSILSSTPVKIEVIALRSLKVLRLFKLSRSFSETKVLTGTAMKAWKQILGIISFLFFLVTVFAILLYEVEKGSPCYVGDPDPDLRCPDEIIAFGSDIAAQLRPGAKVFINKLGNVSNFNNVLYSLWFSFVTLTTTGYGDFVPATNTGLMMAIFIMLAGSFYMAMPLTAAASAFYREHCSHNKHIDDHAETVVSMKEEAIDDLTKNILILQSEFMDSELKLKDFINCLREKAVPGNGAINENVTSYDQVDDVKMVNINILKGYDRDGSSKDSSKLIRKVRIIVDEINQLLEIHKNNVKKLAVISVKAQLEHMERLLKQ